MDFNFTSDQKQLRNKIRDFTKKVIAPEADEFDKKSEVPIETFRLMGKEGFTGIGVPKEYGGLEGGLIETCIVWEEIATESPGHIQGVFWETMRVLAEWGNEDQKKRYLNKLASGEWLGATVISELQMGSSFSNMKTTAKKGNGCYVLNGTKAHINDALEAGLFCVYVKTGNGISVFLVENGTPGIDFNKREDVMGLRAMPVYDVTFKNCKVPEGNLVSEEGKGLEIFLSAFNYSRVAQGAMFVGIAKGILEKALKYGKHRKVRDQSHVTDFQGIQWMVADLYTKFEAASLLVYKAAWLADNGKDFSREASMAKLFAGEIAFEVVHRSMSLVGGMSCYYRFMPFERFMRDVKTQHFAGGSLEILRNYIARDILKRGLIKG